VDGCRVGEKKISETKQGELKVEEADVRLEVLDAVEKSLQVKKTVFTNRWGKVVERFQVSLVLPASYFDHSACFGMGKEKVGIDFELMQQVCPFFDKKQMLTCEGVHGNKNRICFQDYANCVHFQATQKKKESP
jgi:hypothetical protein